MEDSELIDLIYEAGLVPDLWPSVLAHLDRRFEGVGTGLFVAGPGHFRWTCSPFFEEALTAFFRDGWASNNVRPERVRARKLTGFVTERDLFEPEELANDPLFTQFMRPRGLGGELGTVIPVPTGDHLVLSINRPFELGPASPEAVAEANALRPHLARAALLSSRLRLERAEAATEALRVIGIAAAVLGGSGRILTANTLFQALIPELVLDRPARVALVDRQADALLKASLERLPRDPLRGGVNSIAIKGSDLQDPYIAHLLPIRRTAHDIFSGADVLLLMARVDKSAVPEAKLLEGLFDLTPAETRIAREIADGSKTLEAIANEFRISRETVRTQLRSVLDKTGAQRLTELIALLSGVGRL